LADLVGVTGAPEKTRAELVEEISRKLRSAAGHFAANLFRGPDDLPYKQMLIDVLNMPLQGWNFWARKDYLLDDKHSESDVEDAIWKSWVDGSDFHYYKWPPEVWYTAGAQVRRITEPELLEAGYSPALVAEIGETLVGEGTVVEPTLAWMAAVSTIRGRHWLKERAEAGSGSSGDFSWGMLAAGAHRTLMMLLGMVLLSGPENPFEPLVWPPSGLWLAGWPHYGKTRAGILRLIQSRKLREIADRLG
jgi:hypothetical protein